MAQTPHHIVLMAHVNAVARETGTSPEHVANVLAAHVREQEKGRSPEWRTHRLHWLHGNPQEGIEPHDTCAACGGKDGLQVHHVEPFHENPALELDYHNYITLCETVGGPECHEKIGHGGDFKHYNPHVRADAAEFLKATKERRQQIVEHAEANRKPNVPVKKA
jgi:5-methylcytosine-specific restriction enzyme A